MTDKKMTCYISLVCGSIRKVTGKRGGVARILKGFNEDCYSSDFTIAYIQESLVDNFCIAIDKLYSKYSKSAIKNTGKKPRDFVTGIIHEYHGVEKDRLISVCEVKNAPTETICYPSSIVFENMQNTDCNQIDINKESFKGEFIAMSIEDFHSISSGENKNKVLSEIQKEREYQDKKWGGISHDDEHTVFNFLEFISDKACSANESALNKDIENTRKRLVQMAALMVASIELLDRKGHESILFQSDYDTDCSIIGIEEKYQQGTGDYVNLIEYLATLSAKGLTDTLNVKGYLELFNKFNKVLESVQ